MLLLVCLLGSAMHAVSQHSNNICKAVLSVTEQLNAAKRSFIFRCRPGDDCGGIGDRLGGVMGGAFYALQTGRSFRILWPGLDHVFKPGYSNWTFDAVTLNVPYEDASGQELDKTRITDVNGNQVMEPFTDRKDVLVVNDLNSRQITNATLSAVIDRYQHVFFHSNRGPTRDMYSAIHKKYNWATSFPDTEESYAAVYHCVFEGLFRPTEEFLSSEYASISRATVPFTHIIRVIEDPKYTSMAFHHRVDDGTAAANAANEVIDATHLAKIIELSRKHAVAEKKMNLFFVTNSIPSAKAVMADAGIQKAFHAVYCQELKATIHVNMGTGNGEQANSAAVRSTLQAMRDWWVMRLVDVLICPMSGFSKSAALLAPTSQIRYEDGGYAYRENYWSMCGNRFC
jgi:hypothetical protein